MTDKIKRGFEGEGLAIAFLENKGYRLRAKNYRHKRSEIDLIMERGSWLVFVEVKTRSSVTFGYPEDFVDDKKANKIMEGAENYIIENNWEGNVRYDVVAVTLRKDGPEIVHFEDAFY
ncbi:MAG: YraN family protein [Cyclobacteriaceae bacterium]|nr:YraN family protein [Cyclobacteriaceae bacterium]MCB9237681.1 YraN family protein [Flammeovirgaceae bacterium]MCB0498805.1 YraN family protein [Cyclobacteriaceae bacterium]MCO5270217.1 YraN family protein [Cyclobacteriaceae bacterium]MCW5903796.1 YraN family protein [Cyclobacteriaceae bacterium]